MALKSFEDVLESVTRVDGWMSDDQARRLFDAAATTRAGEQIVEIGSFRGRSTIVLASAAPDGVRVFAIDPHAGNDRGPEEIEGFVAEAEDDHAVFLANLREAGVEDRVTHLRKFSDKAHRDVPGEIAMLYVDGAHRYKPARADIRTWGTRVADGGTMLIHDSFSSVGVTLAILRELVFGGRFRYVGRARSLTVYEATLERGPRARLVNAARQLAQLPWFAKNLTLKVLLKLKLGPLLARVTGSEPEWPY
jgi:predicted O-methyltransferase YrrM